MFQSPLPIAYQAIAQTFKSNSFVDMKNGGSINPRGEIKSKDQDSPDLQRLYACTNCKKRKTKCDKASQCSTCNLYGMVCLPLVSSSNSSTSGGIKKNVGRKKKKVVETATTSLPRFPNNHRSSLSHSSLEEFPDEEDSEGLFRPHQLLARSISPSSTSSFTSTRTSTTPSTLPFKLEPIELPQSFPSSYQIPLNDNSNQLPPEVRIWEPKFEEGEYKLLDEPRNARKRPSKYKKKAKLSDSAAIPLLESTISRQASPASTYATLQPQVQQYTAPIQVGEYFNPNFYPAQFQYPPRQDYRNIYYTAPDYGQQFHYPSTTAYSNDLQLPSPAPSTPATRFIDFASQPNPHRSFHHQTNQLQYHRESSPAVRFIYTPSQKSFTPSPSREVSRPSSPTSDVRLPPLRNVNGDRNFAKSSGVVMGFDESERKFNLPSIRKWFCEEEQGEVKSFVCI